MFVSSPSQNIGAFYYSAIWKIINQPLYALNTSQYSNLVRKQKKYYFLRQLIEQDLFSTCFENIFFLRNLNK